MNFPFAFVKTLDVYSGAFCTSLHSLMHVDTPITSVYPWNERPVLFCCKPCYIPLGLSENGACTLSSNGKKRHFHSRNSPRGIRIIFRHIQTSSSWLHIPFIPHEICQMLYPYYIPKAYDIPFIPHEICLFYPIPKAYDIPFTHFFVVKLPGRSRRSLFRVGDLLLWIDGRPSTEMSPEELAAELPLDWWSPIAGGSNPRGF